MCLAIWVTQLCFAQNDVSKTAFGIKGGMVLGIQKWNGFDQGPLFKYQGDLFVEDANNDDKMNVFASLGYHVRGSALRNGRISLLNGDQFRLPAQTFEFNNLSLGLGAKSKFAKSENSRGYYSFAARVEYTLNTNLSQYEEAAGFNLSFPTDTYVRNFTYGITVGAGYEFMFSELTGGFVEINLMPDFSNQYLQPAIGNIPSPWQPGSTITIEERKIKNISIEFTVGFRFIRKVEYY